MSKHTRLRTVYVTKLPEPLIIDQYELTVSYAKNKMYRPERYWRIYSELKAKFLELNEEMRQALLKEKFVPPWLHEEYEQAKANFLAAQEIINRDYDLRISQTT